MDWIKDTAFDLWHILHPSKQDMRENQPLKWKAPADQWIKCNVDGCFFEHSGQGSTGVVIRDHTGTCRGAQARWHEHCADALMMEAYACKEGLEFAGQCGVQRVHLETDCLELVRLWKLEERQQSMIMPVLQEVKELSQFFQDFSLMLEENVIR